MDDPNWFPDQTLKATWLTRAFLLILFEKRLESSLRGFDSRGHFRRYWSPKEEELYTKI